MTLAAEMPDSPTRNLMLNQWKMELSWMSSMNFTEDWCLVTAGGFTETIMVNLPCKVLMVINHYTFFFFFHILK